MSNNTPVPGSEFNNRTYYRTVYGTCSVDGCDKPQRSKGLCNMHYTRERRHGDASISLYDGSRRTAASHGYVWLHGRHGHPLANSKGKVYEHRFVLWEKVGPGKHECFWCGVELDWFATNPHRLIVDHINFNRSDNRLENLVPACNRCNTTREK